MNFVLFWALLGLTTASVNITNLLIGYDTNLPPNATGITTVKYELRAPVFVELSEIQTNFRLSITEYMVWHDPRLAFTSSDSQK
jgi:hypothetical protein